MENQTLYHKAVTSKNIKLLDALLKFPTKKYLVWALQQRDSCGRTAMDLALQGERQTASKIIEVIVQSLSTEEAFTLLKSKDQQGDTLIHHLVMWECNHHNIEKVSVYLTTNQLLELFHLTK